MSTFLIEQGYAINDDVPVKPQTEHSISELLLYLFLLLFFFMKWFTPFFDFIFSPDLFRILSLDSLLTASFENFKRLSGGKNENSEARPPEPLTQGVGDTFTAVVTHLQSPSEILCQKLENASELSSTQFKTVLP